MLPLRGDILSGSAMVTEAWRVLAAGGLFFARLASNIGLESQLGRSPGRMQLPDGSMRFVVTEALLIAWTTRLGGRARKLGTSNARTPTSHSRMTPIMVATG
jgi:hypothetical protein